MNIRGGTQCKYATEAAKQDLIIANFTCWGACGVLIENCYLIP